MKFLIVGLIIFISFRLTYSLAKNIQTRKGNIGKIVYSIPIIEIFVWLFYLIWTINNLFGDKFFYPTLVISIIIFVLIFGGWFIARDFISGMILKTDPAIVLGCKIKFNDIEGKILDLGYLIMIIESSEGEKVMIPYRKLNGEQLTLSSTVDYQHKNTIHLELEKQGSIEQIKKSIQKLLLSYPTCHLNKEPQIAFDGNNKDFFKLKINFYTIINEQEEKVKAYLLSHLNEPETI